MPDESRCEGSRTLKMASSSSPSEVALARISDLKVGNNAVQDIHRLCLCANRTHGSLPEVDIQWVRAKISFFNSRSTNTKLKSEIPDYRYLEFPSA